MTRPIITGLIFGMTSVPLLAGCGESTSDVLYPHQAQQQQFSESQRQLDESMRSFEESMRIQQEIDRVLRDQQEFQEYLQRNPQVFEPARAEPAPLAPVQAARVCPE